MTGTVQEGFSGTSRREREAAMRLTGRPGEWLWRRLRLGTWFARRKAEKLTGTTAEAGPDAAGRVADRVTGREKAPSRQRGRGRGAAPTATARSGADEARRPFTRHCCSRRA